MIKLTEAHGVSGHEGEVRKLIKERLAGHVDKMYTDRMGNLIAVKNETAGGKHVALSAHMDEVGLYIKIINAEGFLKFAPIGIDPRVLVAKSVLVGSQKKAGVIGVKPIHLQKPEERNNAFSVESMFIDIGASSKEDAEKYVAPGDYAVFDSSFTYFGDHKIKAKALDDRVGCAAIIDLFKSNIPCKLTGIFCTQEEVGLRGSAIAANQVKADIVINIEGTICADTAGVKEKNHVTTLGGGPAISLTDTGSIYLKEMTSSIVKIAKENNIPYQYRRTGFGGTDSRSYHLAGEGTPVIGISVPCRYIHSPVSVMDERDYENLLRLVSAYV